MRSTAKFILIFGFGIVIGCVSLEVVKQRHFLIFEPKISLGETVNALAALVAAAIVTVFITFVFEKHNETARVEKNLLLKRLDLIFGLAEEFEKAITQGILTEVTSSQKKLSMSCASFLKLLADFDYPSEILTEASFDAIIREIRDLATDTPIKGIEELAEKSQCSASVREGLIRMTSDRKAIIEGKINALKSQIIKAQLVLNRKR